jgi:FixJ family two-component response regulator
MIAVVDDDESVRTAIRGVLESVGFNVMPFASAEEFLARQDGSFACLISDVKMPGIDGLELQRRLARKGSDIPIIFVSGYGSELSRSSALSAGAIGFLDKPFDDNALIELVQSALRS